MERELPEARKEVCVISILSSSAAIEIITYVFSILGYVFSNIGCVFKSTYAL